MPEDGFDERGWLARRGVHVVLHGGDWRIVGRRGGIGGVSDRLRAHVARAIAPGLGGERRAVLAGIVLGEDEGLTDELRANFKASGLYHLLAVSGQNVAFLAIGVLGLAWLLGINRLAAEVAAIGAIAAYVLAVGWQPSVVRAGVAGGLASLAWLLARPRDRWHFLALGAAVLLAWTPACLFEPGFQLSFAAVGAIFLLLPKLRLALEGYPMPAWLRDALAVSTACGAATAPILWLQFGSVPVYSLLANALVALAIGPLLGLALVGSLLEPVLPSVALALAWVNGWLAAYIAACAGARRRAAARPDRLGQGGVRAARDAACPARTPAAAPVAAAGGAWRALRPSFPPCSSGSSSRPRRCRRRRGSASRSSTSARATRSSCRWPRAAILVDEGPPEANVAQQLRTLGVRRLAAVVLTHPQRDHIGGAETVLRRIAVDRVLDPRLTQVERLRARCSGRGREARRRGRRDAGRRHVPARPAAPARALAGSARHGERGSEPACRSSCSPRTARSTRS